MYIENLLLASFTEVGFYFVVFLFVAGIIVMQLRGFLPIQPIINKNYENQTDFFYVKELLTFTAHMIKIDGHVSKIETEYVNKFLYREYGRRKQKKYVSIVDSYIRNGYNLEKSINSVNNKCDMSSKLQLIHFLIKVSIIDGYLSTSEFQALSEITQKLNLTYHQLNSILAMYSFTSEKEERQKKQYKKHSVKTKTSKIKLALAILEITESSTNDDIKKAYRKLVVLYHPDKTMHLDKYLQKGAKEMYQKVNDAYDFLKEDKGFK